MYLTLDLVELRTTTPFASYSAQDEWTGIQLVNMFLIEYTSPVTVPLMWVLLQVLRPLPRGWGRALIAVMTLSTIGVLLFWVWALHLSIWPSPYR